ncbi:uncharacterized protein BYT42DRAFT_559105 [Radiomyces spectabilis]|uniref:uncharacterized protein n=1 Tax=Radiomyces spectabilis TaxID=64574 RepID=UPI00221E7623|nr:uncharacterized protein BYT42DRAFT_559105 [Radiomyces spectabilis]KAI8388149.1 hypothetical protein BYT42DRAFT_559105 [Radiomyces spectabilis]
MVPSKFSKAFPTFPPPNFVKISITMAALVNLLKFSRPEVLPLMVIVGGALTGVAYCGIHATKIPAGAWHRTLRNKPVY